MFVMSTDYEDSNSIGNRAYPLSIVTAAVNKSFYHNIAILIFQIELPKYFAVNTATAHAHYEGEATYNIGSSFNGRPHFNIIKIHPQTRDGGESIGTIF